MNDEPEYTNHLDGSKRWRLNDTLHRLDGPAIEYRGGGGQWYIHGDPIHITPSPLSVGQSFKWNTIAQALVIKQINPILFQLLIGDQNLYLFSLHNSEYDNVYFTDPHVKLEEGSIIIL